LVERFLAKEEVAGSSPVSRSSFSFVPQLLEGFILFMKKIGKVFLKSSAEKKIRNFYLWVYKDEIEKVVIDDDEGLVDVLSPKGEFICVGYYSKYSRNPIKVFSYSKKVDVDFEVSKRILMALEERFRMAKSGLVSPNSFRVVFSESDFLPGLVIDKYGDYVGFQIRNRFFESLRDYIIEAIDKLLSPVGIYERSDIDYRMQEENLSPRNVPAKGKVPDVINIVEWDTTRFLFPTFSGQKTGFFLDQSFNRKIISELVSVETKVLDMFSYVGGFGIFLAKKGANVVCVEKSLEYSDFIKENAEANGVTNKVRVITGDAFSVIDSIQEKFDLIILDPPTFVKSLSESRKRLPMLIDLIKKSFQLLNDNGKLVVFSCSYNLLKEHLIAAIRIACMELGIRVKVERELMQSPDHPWALQMPETLYLKGFVLSKLPY
jgi:23S rRNA (cytosine1962-C5)-methyltransferase